MSNTKKNIKDFKYGLTGTKKKVGVNFVRYFFNGIEAITGSEQQFFIELEMLNPWISPSEVQLGFTPRVKLNEEDLQYALAGTQSAKSLDTETLVQPSYCVIRVGKLGSNAKQMCYYFPVKEAVFNTKPFEISIGNKSFSETKTNGFINISPEEKASHPEFLCDSGYVTWDLSYDNKQIYTEGFSDKTMRWFPYGIHTNFSGKINFDGTDYVIDSRKSYGYLERFWGSKLPEPWFHISVSNLTSVITGKTLFNSAFSVQGIFDDKVSFIGNFEDVEVKLCADAGKKKYNSIWDCNQLAESENADENQIHWSVSLNNKCWIIDIDIYCKIKELFNRSVELPEGQRKVMSLLEGATGTGEVKLYKCKGATLEQIEHAKFTKVLCEIGHVEEGEN